MADDVTIKFTADVSGLQQGMQGATSAVEATTNALRSDATHRDQPSPTLSRSRRKLAITSVIRRSLSADWPAPQAEMRQKNCAQVVSRGSLAALKCSTARMLA